MVGGFCTYIRLAINSKLFPSFLNSGFFPAVGEGQSNLGFPGWREVCDWLDESFVVQVPEDSPVKAPLLKNPEVPQLENYRLVPDEKFWESFPKKDLPVKVETEVLTEVFEDLINKASCRMTASELRRARKVVNDLKNGADAYQRGPLPPVNSVNSQSTFEHGRLLTDTAATWVKKGFVAGPFDYPPVPGFRTNPLGVVVKNGKVRPILLCLALLEGALTH